MSQEQQRQGPVTYGDVFDVSGDLGSKLITPQDAATMQSAENVALGKTQKGGVAATMQAAADQNERLGAVGHGDITDVAREQGVSVMETDVGTRRFVVEAVGDQVLGQYDQPTTGPSPTMSTGPTRSPDLEIPGSPITIGEALEASALGAGDKPVDMSDAAAIQAAELRATGTILPGGVGATAQSAATHNVRTLGDKTTLGDVLEDATTKLAGNKPATREDAEGVISAEMRNNPLMTAYPGGVADSVAAAARLNVQL